MMKRLMMILSALVLALCGTALAATPSDLHATPGDLVSPATPSSLRIPEGGVTVVGTVTALEDGCFLMLSDDGIQLQVNVDGDTQWLGQEVVAMGDVVSVVYNGAMTRSIPGQIYGQSVSCYTLTGVVTELLEGGFLLTDAEGVVVEVRAEDALLAGLRLEQTVVVYFNGVMTASLPGQVNALHIRLPELAGVVDEVSEDSFLMTDAEGTQWQVNISPDTKLWVEPIVGQPIRVCQDGTATFSLPAQVYAYEVLG